MISLRSRNIGFSRCSRSITDVPVDAGSDSALKRGSYALTETPYSDHIVSAAGGR
jgi:hypothetical protein